MLTKSLADSGLDLFLVAAALSYSFISHAIEMKYKITLNYRM